MNFTKTNVDFDLELLDRVLSIDLENIRAKLCDKNHGEGWTKNETDEAIKKYRNFLYLSQIYPNTSIIPTKSVDKVWHSHILDTRSYQRDCLEAFGNFIHHDPFYGLNGVRQKKALLNAFIKTCALYERHFGEKYDENFSPEVCRITACRYVV